MAHTFLLDSALAWVGSVVLAGDGAIGDLIGTTITRSITTVDISHAAERFITAAIFITVEGGAKSGEVASIIQGKRPGLLRETAKRREDTLPRAARAAFAQAHSAATTMVERPGVTHRVGELAPVAEGCEVAEVMAVEEVTAAADVIDRVLFGIDGFPVIA